MKTCVHIWTHRWISSTAWTRQISRLCIPHKMWYSEIHTAICFNILGYEVVALDIRTKQMTTYKQMFYTFLFLKQQGGYVSHEFLKDKKLLTLRLSNCYSEPCTLSPYREDQPHRFHAVKHSICLTENKTSSLFLARWTINTTFTFSIHKYINTTTFRSDTKDCQTSLAATTTKGKKQHPNFQPLTQYWFFWKRNVLQAKSTIIFWDF